jgi:hypothetical protein
MERQPFDDEAFLRVFAKLYERQARLVAPERALALGHGGRTRVARLTGLSYPTLRRGMAELRGEVASAVGLAPGRLLRGLGYSLQANRKDKEGFSPPERDAQFTYLNQQARTLRN